MYKIANLSQKDKETLFNYCAVSQNVADVIIEKDFWITLILDYLFNKNKYKDYFVFKGGTCLSKCFGITKRFSEDIDIVLDWKAIGLTEAEAYTSRSSKAREKFKSEVVEKVGSFVTNKLIPSIKQDFDRLIPNQIKITTDPLDKRNIFFMYKNVFSDSFINSPIRLEIGCLSAIGPNQIVKIQPYLSNSYKALINNGQTTVRSVIVEYIFWEKVLLLHQIGCSISNMSRLSRHFYDLSCMVKFGVEKTAIEKKELLNQTIKVTNTFYYRASSKLNELNFKNILLVPDILKLNELEKDYIQMTHMIFMHDIPKFSEILDNIKKVNLLINKIN